MSAEQSHTVPRTVEVSEFWRLRRVLEVSGLSKSELYRQIGEGRFPKSRCYRDSPTSRFWLSNEVRDWQRAHLGDDFEALL